MLPKKNSESKLMSVPSDCDWLSFDIVVNGKKREHREKELTSRAGFVARR